MVEAVEWMLKVVSREPWDIWMKTAYSLCHFTSHYKLVEIFKRETCVCICFCMCPWKHTHTHIFWGGVDISLKSEVLFNHVAYLDLKLPLPLQSLTAAVNENKVVAATILKQQLVVVVIMQWQGQGISFWVKMGPFFPLKGFSSLSCSSQQEPCPCGEGYTYNLTSCLACFVFGAFFKSHYNVS